MSYSDNLCLMTEPYFHVFIVRVHRGHLRALHICSFHTRKMHMINHRLNHSSFPMIMDICCNPQVSSTGRWSSTVPILLCSIFCLWYNKAYNCNKKIVLTTVRICNLVKQNRIHACWSKFYFFVYFRLTKCQTCCPRIIICSSAASNVPRSLMVYYFHVLYLQTTSARVFSYISYGNLFDYQIIHAGGELVEQHASQRGQGRQFDVQHFIADGGYWLNVRHGRLIAHTFEMM